jgi:hypothetical protein
MDDEAEAARAYARAARQYFGEFARLNFPDETTTTRAEGAQQPDESEARR